MRLFPSRSTGEVTASPVELTDARPIKNAFQNAQRNGITSPNLRLGAFLFYLAPPAGANGGSIYVKRNRTWLGKIRYGRFYPAGECDAEAARAIAMLASNPLEGAVAYGKATKRCSCCARLLTNEESVELGIGPICRGRFFGE